MTITATSDNQIRKSNIRNWTIGLQTFATGSLPRSGLVQRQLWNIDSGSASLRLDAAEFDHLGPLLGFVGDQLCEVSGRARKRRAAELSETDLHLRIVESRVDLLVELVDDLGRGGLRCADAEPETRFVARHKLIDSRHVG